MLVLGGNQTDRATGQPQSGPWFGSIDDLFSFGRPSGWGGPWRHDAVKAHEPSDPFLMLGFQRKGVHIVRDGDDGAIAGGLMAAWMRVGCTNTLFWMPSNTSAGRPRSAKVFEVSNVSSATGVVAAGVGSVGSVVSRASASAPDAEESVMVLTRLGSGGDRSTVRG